MTKDDVYHFATHIEAYTNRNLSERAVDKIAESLENTPKDAAKSFLAALDNGSYQGRLDPLDIIREVKGLATNLREKEARIEKQQFNEGLDKSAARTEVGKKTVFLVRCMIAGKITANEYVSAIYELESQFPNIGFKRSGSNAQRIFDRTGQPMNEAVEARPIDAKWRMRFHD